MTPHARDPTETGDRIRKLLDQLPDETERRARIGMIDLMVVLLIEAQAGGDAHVVNRAWDFMVDEERRAIEDLARIRQAAKENRRNALHLVVQVSIPAAAILLAGFWFH